MRFTANEIEQLRKEEFPATRDTVHLKAAGGSPMCRSAHDAAMRYLKEMCFEGDLHYEAYLEAIDSGRRRIARIIGADTPETIAFSVNASSAAAVMAEMFEHAGVTRVYYPVSEFPTSVHAVTNRKIPTVQVGDEAYRDGPDAWLAEVARHLESHPLKGQGALVISHVSFITGETIDFAKTKAFAARQGLVLVINATQSFGALKMDVSDGVDLLFATGLKWAAAGYGAGFMYIRQGWLEAVGLPSHTGWLSVSDPYRMDHRNTDPISVPASLDAGGGMPHFAPLMALDGALSVYERLGGGDIRQGISRVQARVIALADYLRAGLRESGFQLLGQGGAARSGIVSIRSPEAESIFEQLMRNRVLTSLRRDPKTDRKDIVRFGVHYFNRKKELDSALSVLR
jgi:cysteine desulfurase / selenocysteine lyase